MYLLPWILHQVRVPSILLGQRHLQRTSRRRCPLNQALGKHIVPRPSPESTVIVEHYYVLIIIYYIVVCQRGRVSNKLLGERHGPSTGFKKRTNRTLYLPFLLRQGESGTSQYKPQLKQQWITGFLHFGWVEVLKDCFLHEYINIYG